MRKAIVFFILGATALPGVGCNNNNTGGPISASDFTARLIQAVCGAQSRCQLIAAYACASGGLSAGLPDFSKAIAAGRVRYDGTQAQACLDYLSGLACGDLGMLRGEPTACMNAVTGTVATGGTCYNGVDCAGGDCQFDNQMCPGKCVAYLASGADCTMGGACNQPAGQSCINGKCGAPGAVGATCQSSSDCGANLRCAANQCAALAGAGAACTSTTDCAASLYCLLPAMGMGACMARIAIGGVCGAAGPQIPDCVAGAACAGAALNIGNGTTTTGKCQAVSDEGGPCVAIAAGVVGTTGCLLGLVCTGGTCAKPPSTGPCANDPLTPCLYGSSYCDPATTTCKPLLANGAACQDSSQCLSRQCNNNACAPSGGTCAEM